MNALEYFGVGVLLGVLMGIVFCAVMANIEQIRGKK